MVTSIVLTGKYNIGISSTNKIKTPDGITVELKDIPFVRYRFKEYGESEIEFIKETMKKFPCAHLIEINLDENTAELLNKLSEMQLNLAKFIYIGATDEEADSRRFSDAVISNLKSIAGCTFDALNIKDNSTKLCALSLQELRREIRLVTGVKEASIGVCGGPMCFMDGNACLTAVKARELMAIYGTGGDDMVVPSANHERRVDTIDESNDCINRCGCIRYYIFNHDTEAPSVRTPGTKKVTVKDGDETKEITTEVKDKKPKAVKSKTYTKVLW